METLWIELYERYAANGQYSVEWWEENMPESAKMPTTYQYRRISRRLEDIEQIAEIEGNNEECIIRFYSGEQIVVKDNFDDLCILFNDFCNGNLEFPEEENASNNN